MEKGRKGELERARGVEREKRRARESKGGEREKRRA